MNITHGMLGEVAKLKAAMLQARMSMLTNPLYIRRWIDEDLRVSDAEASGLRMRPRKGII